MKIEWMNEQKLSKVDFISGICPNSSLQLWILHTFIAWVLWCKTIIYDSFVLEIPEETEVMIIDKACSLSIF